MSNTVVKEILVKARELIENPKNWLQGEFARDAEGKPCFSYEKQAVCFCSIGALRRASVVRGDNRWATSAYRAAREVLQDKMGTNIDAYNDGYSHQEVLLKFDEAIKSLE